MQEQLKLFQQQLKNINYYPGKIDGLWGNASQLALNHAIRDGKVEIYFDFMKFKKIFDRPKITQDFVNSINILFETFKSLNNHDDKELQQATNPLYISYMLATSWHETAKTMLPITELGSNAYLSKYDTGRLAKNLGNTPQADGDGQLYRGRGYVQITGRRNYKLFSALLGMDLIAYPEYTLIPKVAAKILVVGSLKGLFTGVKLSDFIKVGKEKEFYDCRRVINGTDRAADIQKYVSKFLDCLIIKQL